MRKLIRLIICAVLCSVLLIGCGSKNAGSQRKKDVKRSAVQSSELQFTAPSQGDTIAIFDTSLGEIRAVLYPQHAPMAVENFTGLAQQGYYNGVSFHRVLYGFVVQGGDATGKGTGGASIWNNNPYPIEPSPKLHHYSGALCAARSEEDERSTLSQFYFVQSLPEKLNKDLQAQMEQAGIAQEVIDTYNTAGGLPYLDYTDTVFGQVYQGLEIVDSIAQAETDENGRPAQDILINSITITTYSST